MNWPTILAVLVIGVALPVNWYVAYKLWRKSRGAPQLRVLRERMWASLALALVVTVFAFVFVNNSVLDPPPLDPLATQIVTRLAILSLSIPALYWLWLYRNGGADR